MKETATPPNEVAAGAPRTPFVAVITAAGMGARMGGPKGLIAVPWGDMAGEVPLAVAHAWTYLDAGAERAVVVARAPVARVLSAFGEGRTKRRIDVVVSTEPDEFGPAGSIRRALAYLDLDPDAWVLVVPVDTPPASRSLLDALLLAVATDPPPLASRPIVDGRRGHPVLVRRRALEPLVENQPPPPLRDVLRALGTDVTDVPVEDRRAACNLDTPEDVQAFFGNPVRFFDHVGES